MICFFKSCETIQYKFVGKEAEATVTGISKHRGRRGSITWKVTYKVKLAKSSFAGDMSISESEIEQYPKGKKIQVLVLHPGRPFPSSVVKGHETSFWLYIFIVMVVGGSIWVVRVVRAG